jgi:photosystem II stability/assembly factor-like uncharacterized protein
VRIRAHRLLLIAAVASLAAASPARSQTVLWEPTNGPEGGYIYSMTSNDQGHIFASAGTGCMFRSVNGGASWDAINNHDQADSFGPQDVWYNPATKTLLASNGCRIYRSTDEGAHWVNSDFLWGCNFMPMAAPPSGSPVYVGSAALLGLWRSDDDGQH